MKEGAVGGWLLALVAAVLMIWFHNGGAADAWHAGRVLINETLSAKHISCGEPSAVEWVVIGKSVLATYLAWPNAFVEFLMWSDAVSHHTYTFVGLASIEAPPWSPGCQWPYMHIVFAILEPLVHMFRVTWLLAVRFSFCESDYALTATFCGVFVVLVLGPNVPLCLLSRLIDTKPIQRAVRYWDD